MTGSDTDRSEHVSILEYNERAADFGRPAGERAFKLGHQRNSHVPCDEKEGFVKIAEAVAIFELPRPMDDDELSEWCETDAAKLALAHWFDEIDPNEVVDS